MARMAPTDPFKALGSLAVRKSLYGRPRPLAGPSNAAGGGY